MTRAPQTTFRELKECQFSSWYPTFHDIDESIAVLDKSEKTANNMKQRKFGRKNVTIKSKILSPLPQEFLDYLQSDGLLLPEGAGAVSSFIPKPKATDDCWSSEEDDSIDGNVEEHGTKSETDSVISETPQMNFSFPGLNESIKEAINSLGGSVIPKLNWSAPKDATWLHDSHTMKCTTVGDIYLLLKGSDFILHDLIHALDDICLDHNEQNQLPSDSDKRLNSDNLNGNIENISYELVLRKWSNLHASMEFRCFVANHTLVGISQRNHTQCYSHLKRDRMSLRSNILDFYRSIIQHRFAKGLIENYVFDVYIDKNNRAWIVDFNPWASRTDPLMFSWDELVEYQQIAKDYVAKEDFISEESAYFHTTSNMIGSKSMDNSENEQKLEDTNFPIIRVVETENEVRQDPLSSYRAPIDTVNLAADRAGSTTFEDFMKMCEKPSNMK